MTQSAAPSPAAIVWDFDGTILPFDSEQALLLSLSRDGHYKLGWLKGQTGRALAWADRHNYLARSFKHWYVRSVRGLPVEDLDALARELATHITAEDRQAIRDIHALCPHMLIISCGTGDMSERVIAAAGLRDCFEGIEANWFTFWEDRIEGMDLAMPMSEDKVEAARRLGVDLGQAVAIGDGITDIPVLDRARYPILLDRDGRRASLAARGYQTARSIPDVARIVEEISHRWLH